MLFRSVDASGQPQVGFMVRGLPTPAALVLATDLIGWTSLCTNQVLNGAIDFVDPDAPADQYRFYRAVPEAGSPPQ